MNDLCYFQVTHAEGITGGREQAMAQRCVICGKGPQFGHRVSHAGNRTKHKFEPNLHRVRARINGAVRRIRVCTRCLKAGKVVKAA